MAAWWEKKDVMCRNLRDAILIRTHKPKQTHSLEDKVTTCFVLASGSLLDSCMPAWPGNFASSTTTEYHL